MRLWYLLFPLLLAGCVSVPRQETVACVGDSITYGSRIDDRVNKAYPKVLGDLLGPRYTVLNFGVSGATMLKKGDKPYWQQPDYAKALASAPTIVVLMLGTNDSKPRNFSRRAEFTPDAEALIDSFLALSSQPKVYLCLPSPVYKTTYTITEANLVPLRAEIEAIAKAKRLPLIDIHTTLSGHPELFPDAVHPNAAGAALMAQTVANALRR